ncbi:MAG: DNA helicase UvrD [Candidatus Latescibacteria bacterium]|nr:DNA helicase UvrD [Candidatus Latescibacterota bacterium]
MEFIADLHIHSKFSRATSGDMVIPKIAQAAKEKGISLVATGDFTHPAWLEMLRNDLSENGDGLFKYEDTNFILTSEVNNIYSKNGRLRRLHNIIYAPSFDEAEKINGFLGKYGNLKSDGRPILSLDSKLMLEKILEISPESFVVPAHIWTPWFSVFGSKSGFDSIEECFEDSTKEIFALETGLSSDPQMNWTLSKLDRYSLISNSDAHSPSRLGREANVFGSYLSFKELKQVLKTKDRKRFLYTIEFFPEEGKYHYDGHRNCNVAVSPEESMAHDDLCPVCGKQLTIGVLHRVLVLGDRKLGFVPDNAIPYKSLVPLEEIIGEALNVGRDTLTVEKQYKKLTSELNGEFNVLMYAPIDDIKANSDERIGQAVELMRAGKVQINPGYDGVFGKVGIFSAKIDNQPQSMISDSDSQMKLF